MHPNDVAHRTPSQTSVSLPGYEIAGELEHPGPCALFRAVHDGANVLIKVPRHDTAQAAVALQREFQTLRSLSSAEIPKVRELVHEPWALVLEDPGGTPLTGVDSYGRPDVDLALIVGVQLAATIAELHRLGIAHNDINPASILFEAESGRARLIDFTLATASGRRVCYYSENVQQLFPEDQDLVALDTESYLGVPMADATGATIGYLAVLDVKSMPENPRGRFRF